MNYVGVIFDEGYSNKVYEFRTDLDLEVGDKVVVDASSGLHVATVHEVKDTYSKATKWVVDKIDMEAHSKRIEKEKQLASIKAKMEARRKKLEDFQVYQLLAQNDPEMAKLVEEFSKVVSSDE